MTLWQRFRREVDTQRWDDHRYYHQSRVNQALHLISALNFLVSYGVLFYDPALAALMGWGISMVTRQSGHFFFEPRGYDYANNVTDDYKEAVKVGYNMRRKAVLLAVWAALPVLLWFAPSLGGLIEPATDLQGWLHDVGIAWLALAVTGLIFRVTQLCLQRSVLTAFAWLAKILTDPFVDVALYHRAPLYLLRGQWLDPSPNVRQH